MRGRAEDLDLGQILKLRAFRECPHKKYSTSVSPLTIPKLVAAHAPINGAEGDAHRLAEDVRHACGPCTKPKTRRGRLGRQLKGHVVRVANLIKANVPQHVARVPEIDEHEPALCHNALQRAQISQWMAESTRCQIVVWLASEVAKRDVCQHR
jgi:hypothetical protein